MDPEKGFFLNGEPYPLRGLLRRPDRGCVEFEDEQREYMALAAEIGANTIRLAGCQQTGLFMDLCDEHGMVVWADMPIPPNYSYPEKAECNAGELVKELITQNFNHPSIFFWGIADEGAQGGIKEKPADELHALNDLCHRLDPTRLTTMASPADSGSDVSISSITDVVSLNCYFGWHEENVSDAELRVDGFHAENPEVALGISSYGEEGCCGICPDAVDDRFCSEECRRAYHESMLELFDARPFLWSTYAADVFDFPVTADGREGEEGGSNRRDISRSVRQDVFFAYKAYWAGETFVHLCGSRPVGFEACWTRVKAYAAGVDSVEFWAEGERICSVVGTHVFETDLELEIGINCIEAVGMSGGKKVCSDAMTINVTDGNAAELLLSESSISRRGGALAMRF